MKARETGLDALRGLTVISMVAYHAVWDLVYIYGVNLQWYRSSGAFLWQQSICWTFILLSGYCFSMGRRPARRGLTIFLCGAAVTLVTLVFMPEDQILFGVLTLIGSSMLLMSVLGRPLSRLPAAAGLALFFAVFCGTYHLQLGRFFGLAVPAGLYRLGLVGAFFGTPPEGFFSTDYFPLLPWFALYVCGFYLRRLITKPFLQKCPLLEWIGRHALIIYLAHQVVIYGLLTLWNSFLR